MIVAPEVVGKNRRSTDYASPILTFPKTDNDIMQSPSEIVAKKNIKIVKKTVEKNI